MEGGILVINVVSRIEAPCAAAVEALKVVGDWRERETAVCHMFAYSPDSLALIADWKMWMVTNWLPTFFQLYEEVYELKIDEDINRVLFALPQQRSGEDAILTAAQQLKRTATDFGPWQNGPNLEGLLKNLERLK